MSFSVSIAAQEWREITPLVSNCDTIKRIFGIEECTYPTTRFKTESGMRVTVDFADPRDHCRIPKDAVSFVYIGFFDLPKLRVLETDFTDFVIEPESDAPEGTIIRSEKRGIQFHTWYYNSPTPYVTSVVLFASKENRRKFGCQTRVNK